MGRMVQGYIAASTGGLPGQIKAVIGISAIFAALSILSRFLITVRADGQAKWDELSNVAPMHFGLAAVKGLIVLGLIRRSRCGWWLAVGWYGFLASISIVVGIAFGLSEFGNAPSQSLLSSGLALVGLLPFVVAYAGIVALLVSGKASCFQIRDSTQAKRAAR